MLVERILLATSREGRTPEEYAAEVKGLFEGYSPGRKDLERYSQRKTLDLYWQRRGADGVTGAMQVAHAFLGLRLECAQCHRHPHDVWRQEDLLEFSNFFMRVRKVGFQGDNEKKFPEMAALYKKFNDEAKTLETSLDVEWAHAMAPGANILLVELPFNASFADVGTGVQFAARQPHLVGDLDRAERADLELPLADHHLGVEAAVGEPGGEAVVEVLLDDLAPEDLVRADTAVVAALWCREAADREAVRAPVLHERVLLLDAE